MQYVYNAKANQREEGTRAPSQGSYQPRACGAACNERRPAPATHPFGHGRAVVSTWLQRCCINHARQHTPRMMWHGGGGSARHTMLSACFAHASSIVLQRLRQSWRTRLLLLHGSPKLAQAVELHGRRLAVPYVEHSGRSLVFTGASLGASEGGPAGVGVGRGGNNVSQVNVKFRHAQYSTAAATHRKGCEQSMSRQSSICKF